LAKSFTEAWIGSESGDCTREFQGVFRRIKDAGLGLFQYFTSLSVRTEQVREFRRTSSTGNAILTALDPNPLN